MATNISELHRFHDFVAGKLVRMLSPEDVLAEWRAENPSSEELSESIAAVKKALADTDRGDTARPAEQVIADLRRKYNSSAEQ